MRTGNGQGRNRCDSCGSHTGNTVYCPCVQRKCREWKGKVLTAKLKMEKAEIMLAKYEKMTLWEKIKDHVIKKLWDD